MSGDGLREQLIKAAHPFCARWWNDAQPKGREIIDALLPVIAAHVASETETLRAEVERLREPDLRVVWGYDAGVRDAEAQRLYTEAGDDAYQFVSPAARAYAASETARADDAERRLAAVEEGAGLALDIIDTYERPYTRAEADAEARYGETRYGDEPKPEGR